MHHQFSQLRGKYYFAKSAHMKKMAHCWDELKSNLDLFLVLHSILEQKFQKAYQALNITSLDQTYHKLNIRSLSRSWSRLVFASYMLGGIQLWRLHPLQEF